VGEHQITYVTGRSSCYVRQAHGTIPQFSASTRLLFPQRPRWVRYRCNVFDYGSWLVTRKLPHDHIIEAPHAYCIRARNIEADEHPLSRPDGCLVRHLVAQLAA
jgi:hypothetical protein